MVSARVEAAELCEVASQGGDPRTHRERHAFPKIGKLGVGAVDLASVESVIEPIWYDKPRTGQLVRANIESVLNFAQAKGQRIGDNPARWVLIKHSLPARKGARTAGHYRALASADMPALLKDLGKQDVMSAVCMRVIILALYEATRGRPGRFRRIADCAERAGLSKAAEIELAWKTAEAAGLPTVRGDTLDMMLTKKGLVAAAGR